MLVLKKISPKTRKILQDWTRISEKRMKNQAKTDKIEHGMEERKKDSQIKAKMFQSQRRGGGRTVDVVKKKSNKREEERKDEQMLGKRLLNIQEQGGDQFIREDGTYITYINFGAMLKSISRDDLTELYRLVMQKYGTNGPEDEYERVFWGDLKTMFDPPLRKSIPIPADVCLAMLDKKLKGNKRDEACLSIPLDEIQVDAKLNFMEEPVEILEREFKKLKRSRIAIVKVRWNSKRRPEFTWERVDPT
ncbi:hypothetical protein Tco_0971574 [Tanacetum coccineum]